MITEPTVLGHKGFVPCASGALYNTVRALGPYPKTGWPTSRPKLRMKPLGLGQKSPQSPCHAPVPICHGTINYDDTRG